MWKPGVGVAWMQRLGLFVVIVQTERHQWRRRVSEVGGRTKQRNSLTVVELRIRSTGFRNDICSGNIAHSVIAAATAAAAAVPAAAPAATAAAAAAAAVPAAAPAAAHSVTDAASDVLRSPPFDALVQHYCHC